MTELRELRFASLDEAVAEVRRLQEAGYRRHGEWTLAQVCRHLCLVQDPAITGYPVWMALFAPLRPLMRRWLLPRLLSGNSPRGIPTAAVFVPTGDVLDEVETRKFEESVRRLQAHRGRFAPHPGFGRLDRETFEAIHAAHAAHHLRFLEPLLAGVPKS
jgi:hypothetical protein